MDEVGINIPAHYSCPLGMGKYYGGGTGHGTWSCEPRGVQPTRTWMQCSAYWAITCPHPRSLNSYNWHRGTTLDAWSICRVFSINRGPVYDTGGHILSSWSLQYTQIPPSLKMQQVTPLVQNATDRAILKLHSPHGTVSDLTRCYLQDDIPATWP